MNKENEITTKKINKILKVIDDEKLTVTDLMLLERFISINIEKSVKKMIKEN